MEKIILRRDYELIQNNLTGFQDIWKIKCER